MLFELFGDLNWPAVIVAALAFWVLGAIYFSPPLFQKQWQEAHGRDMSSPSAQQIVGNLVTWFITAIALALVAEGTSADGVWDGLVIGFVAAFGFVAMNRITEGLYTGFRNKDQMKVMAPYNLLGYLIMGVILATWT